jgi:ferritin-like metal-binding protein YciE
MGKDARKQLEGDLVRYLKDAHAMEKHSLTTLHAATNVAGDPQLKALYQGHIRETEEHMGIVERMLEKHGAEQSVLRDVAGKVTAAGLGLGVVAQPDTPAKLVAVAYAFEHFEIASYEMLKRVAAELGDQETVQECDRILVNERQAAEKLGASFDLALKSSIDALGSESTG